MEKFEIDVSNLKIAGSELDVSKTIEELLELNKLIPKRWNEDPDGTTQNQLEKSKKYEGRSSRGEQLVTTEKQFDHAGETFQIVEIEAEKASPQDLGHNDKTWETNDEKINGHKDVPPLYKELYKKESKKN